MRVHTTLERYIIMAIVFHCEFLPPPPPPLSALHLHIVQYILHTLTHTGGGLHGVLGLLL